MRTKPLCQACRLTAPTIRVLSATIFLLSLARVSLAQGTLEYSFEGGDLQGFGPNGGGVTITSDTIGATDGTGSMKVDIVQGATFVGALTGALGPEIGDPPGVDFVTFDVTITTPFPSGVGSFVDAGITIFGASQPGDNQMFGLQVQFFDNQASLGGLTVGTHSIRMDLTSATNPVTFDPGSFDDIIGTDGSGPNDIIPTGFEIYINKSGNAPWTGYIDNIRVGINPVLNADFNHSGLVDAADLTIWKTAFTGHTTAGDANGDASSDGADFLIWQRQLGGAGGGAISAVPEPATIALVACAALFARVGAGRRGVDNR